MKTILRYGRGELSVELPNDADVTVIRKPMMPALDDPEARILDALQRPVEAPPLQMLAAEADSACIAICDITRPVPNRLFLRPMIEVMLTAGMSIEKIMILVATGLHRPNVGTELEELIGDRWVLNNVAIGNHDARHDAQHVSLGVTASRGTVVRLDRRFVEADVRIATGLVEPHFMAGYSGGRKVIAPGLAHAETITTFHSARFMADPGATNCNFENNPLHEEQLAIIKMLGGAWALNTVIDEERKLSFVNFGEIVASHLQAVDFARKYSEVEVDRRFSTVLTSAAGYPLDKTYYQTIKGMVGAMDILRPGGDLIIVSECSEGLGSPEFVASQRRLLSRGPVRFLDDILGKSHAEVDEWQTQMQLKPQTLGKVHLYSNGLSAADHLLTGVTQVPSIEAAVQASIASQADPAIAVIPEGPYVVPFCRNAEIL